jgi:hypothetical protein
LEEIVAIRDSVIHRGLYFHDISPEMTEKLFEASIDLFHILTHVFLAMLSYDKRYQNSIENKWIDFKDVCTKRGSPRFYDSQC